MFQSLGELQARHNYRGCPELAPIENLSKDRPDPRKKCSSDTLMLEMVEMVGMVIGMVRVILVALVVLCVVCVVGCMSQ